MNTSYENTRAIRIAIMVFNSVIFAMVIFLAILAGAQQYEIGTFWSSIGVTLLYLIPIIWGIPMMLVSQAIYRGEADPSLSFGVLQLIFWGIVPGVLDIILTNVLNDEKNGVGTETEYVSDPNPNTTGEAQEHAEEAIETATL